MRGISIAPDTDFNFENDYPVFKHGDKIFIMRVYANDNHAVCYEMGKPGLAVYDSRDFEFIGWLNDVKDEYAEYFV